MTIVFVVSTWDTVETVYEDEADAIAAVARIGQDAGASYSEMVVEPRQTPPDFLASG